MIEIKIPQEISQYEAKLVGPLTTRQTACVVAMGVLAYSIYNILKTTVDANTLYSICFFSAVPFGLVGWYKPYGMPAEKFFLAVLFNTIISSSKRVFKSNNILNTISSKLNTPVVQEYTSKKEEKKAARKNKQGNKNKSPKALKKSQKKYRKQLMK